MFLLDCCCVRWQWAEQSDQLSSCAV